MISEKIELAGHIIDTGQLGQTLDDILTAGGDYVVERFVLGKTKDDDSYLRIEVRAPDNAAMREIMNRITQHGVTAVDPKDARLEPAPSDGVFPEGFYASTNLQTFARLHGDWVEVDNPEMDCALVVSGDTVRTVPMVDVRAGEMVIVGTAGVKV